MWQFIRSQVRDINELIQTKDITKNSIKKLKTRKTARLEQQMNYLNTEGHVRNH